MRTVTMPSSWAYPAAVISSWATKGLRSIRLPRWCATASPTASDKTVFIKSDGRAKYGDVVKLVDEVRSAGVDNVGC